MPRSRVKIWGTCLGALFLIYGFAGAAPPDPLQPARGGGLAVVDDALARLSVHARVLVIGAHPDDEDNSLLAWVAAQGGDAAYLALSRGEGGQNLIGPELGVGLGLIRSEELLAARRVEGNRQFFSRAYDFGYSKSLTESLERWPREAILLDAVRVVRRFRPQVIVSIFRDGESPTHGQHQAAGVIAHAAFAAAGDETVDVAPDGAPGLEPWRPRALYRRAWWRGESEPTLALPLGGVRPIDGSSWAQLADVSRSMHRSQDMGRLQGLGPGGTEVVWVAGGTGPEAASLFSGIDTRLGSLAELVGDPTLRAEIARLLTTAADGARALRARLTPTTLGGAVPSLLVIHQALARAEELAIAADSSAAAELIAGKRLLTAGALLAAAGVVVDARTDVDAVAPGQSLGVELQVWNSADAAVTVLDATVGGAMTAGEAIRLASEPDGPRTVVGGELAAWKARLRVPDNAEPTLPYFLRRPRRGDLYDWSDLPVADWGAPFEAPPLAVTIELEVQGAALEVEREVVQVFADQASGEVRRPLRIVPRLEVEAAPALVMRPAADGGVMTVSVRLLSHAEEALAGRVAIAVPEGWPASEPAPFAIADPRGGAVLEVRVGLPSTLVPGRYHLPVTAELADGETFGAAVPVTDYPHVRPRSRAEPAALDLVVVDLALPEARVGWVLGASDSVPTALAELGVELDVLQASEVAEADLTAYDTVVIGSRAYETNPALGHANARLLDWARAGGNLVVLYQQYQFSSGGFAPYAFEIARPHDRVTDETAAVRILDPEHPIVNRPNRLATADWQGWVQERGLYFGGSWGPEFVPLLAMRDPGEEEALGALLVAELGRGRYVYTGISFFREIPAGVPGAYRLLANLLTPKGDT